MNKPFTVAYEDFKHELADLINNSGLPAIMIVQVLRDYLNEAMMAAARQYQADKAQYEKDLGTVQNGSSESSRNN